MLSAGGAVTACAVSNPESVKALCTVYGSGFADPLRDLTGRISYAVRLGFCAAGRNAPAFGAGGSDPPVSAEDKADGCLPFTTMERQFTTIPAYTGSDDYNVCENYFCGT